MKRSSKQSRTHRVSSRHHHAGPDEGRRPLQAVVRDRRGVARVGTALGASRRCPRRRRPRVHQPGHQPGGQAAAAPSEAEVPSGAHRPPAATLAHVELAAIGPCGSAAAFAVGAGLENAPLGPHPGGSAVQARGGPSRATLMALARARMSVRVTNPKMRVSGGGGSCGGDDGD